MAKTLSYIHNAYFFIVVHDQIYLDIASKANTDSTIIGRPVYFLVLVVGISH